MIGTLLLIMNGMTIPVSTPLHYAIIPEMAYEVGATIMFGTNTFLAAYAKKPIRDFQPALCRGRCGKTAGKHPTNVADKFGIRILKVTAPRNLAGDFGQHCDGLQGRHNGRIMPMWHVTGTRTRHRTRRQTVWRAPTS